MACISGLAPGDPVSSGRLCQMTQWELSVLIYSCMTSVGRAVSVRVRSPCLTRTPCIDRTRLVGGGRGVVCNNAGRTFGADWPSGEDGRGVPGGSAANSVRSRRPPPPAELRRAPFLRDGRPPRSARLGQRGRRTRHETATVGIYCTDSAFVWLAFSHRSTPFFLSESVSYDLIETAELIS